MENIEIIGIMAEYTTNKEQYIKKLTTDICMNSRMADIMIGNDIDMEQEIEFTVEVYEALRSGSGIQELVLSLSSFLQDLEEYEIKPYTESEPNEDIEEIKELAENMRRHIETLQVIDDLLNEFNKRGYKG